MSGSKPAKLGAYTVITFVTDSDIFDKGRLTIGLNEFADSEPEFLLYQ